MAQCARIRAQALRSGQWTLSDSEVSQLLMQLEVTPQGDFDYQDWIAALIDWRTLQVRLLPCEQGRALQRCQVCVRQI